MNGPLALHGGGGIGTMNFGRGPGMQDYWTLNDDGISTTQHSGSPPGTIVQASVNGQPVATGTGHSTRDAIIALVNGFGGQVMTFLNQGQQIHIAQLQYTGQLPGGAAGAGGAGAGGGLTGTIGNALTWASNNTGIVIVGGLILGAFLLQSPRKK